GGAGGSGGAGTITGSGGATGATGAAGGAGTPADGIAGGLWNGNYFQVKNTIVAGNTGGGSPDIYSVSLNHTFTSQGHNLIAHGSGTGSPVIDIGAVEYQRQDLVGRVSQTGQWWVAQSNGSSTFNNTLFATWNPTVTWVDVHTGDFNGDGRDDIIGRELATG